MKEGKVIKQYYNNNTVIKTALLQHQQVTKTALQHQQNSYKNSTTTKQL